VSHVSVNVICDRALSRAARGAFVRDWTARGYGSDRRVAVGVESGRDIGSGRREDVADGVGPLGGGQPARAGAGGCCHSSRASSVASNLKGLFDRETDNLKRQPAHPSYMRCLICRRPYHVGIGRRARGREGGSLRRPGVEVACGPRWSSASRAWPGSSLLVLPCSAWGSSLITGGIALTAQRGKPAGEVDSHPLRTVTSQAAVHCGGRADLRFKRPFPESVNAAPSVEAASGGRRAKRSGNSARGFADGDGHVGRTGGRLLESGSIAGLGAAPVRVRVPRIRSADSHSGGWSLVFRPSGAVQGPRATPTRRRGKLRQLSALDGAYVRSVTARP
jgi:hypothetical protein